MELTGARIGVLMGGLSGEREVSLRSGENVHQALVRGGYPAEQLVLDDPDALIDQLTEIDLAFNCLHGGIGEDGTVQLLLELLSRPYSGSRPLACIQAMDKLAAKRAFEAAGLLTPPHMEYSGQKWEMWAEGVGQTLGFPCVVKPVREGSTLGVQIVDDPDRLIRAAQSAHGDYGELFVERYVPGIEVTTGILRIRGEDRALIPVELRPKGDFYDYEAKYTPGMTEFIVPADLQHETSQTVQESSLEAHRALGCFGFSRVDMRVTPDNDVYVLEVNTAPGMTRTSDLPKSAEAAGIPFDDLVEHMLRTAIEGIPSPSST